MPKTTLLLILLLFTYTNAQLSQCKPINSLFVSDKFEPSSTLNISQFLQEKIPTKKNSLLYLGGGAYGKAFLLDIMLKNSINIEDTQIYQPKYRELALKSVRFKSSDIPDINNELIFLQNMSQRHPLYFLQYMDCGKQLGDRNTAIILTEFLDYDLNSEAFNNLKALFDIKDYLELFLMMAISVKKLHKLNYGHFDLKPANFMIKNSTPYIVKLIDFGMTAKPGFSDIRGTPNYIDPELFNSFAGLKLSNDIFSLGTIYFDLLYGMEKIGFKSKEEFDNDSSRNLRHKNRPKLMVEQMNERLIEMQNADTFDKNELQNLIEINELILNMSNPQSKGRLKIDKVVDKLGKLLNQYEQDSIYLEANSDKLFAMVYPDYEETLDIFNRKPYEPDQANPNSFLNLLCPQRTRRSACPDPDPKSGPAPGG